MGATAAQNQFGSAAHTTQVKLFKFFPPPNFHSAGISTKELPPACLLSWSMGGLVNAPLFDPQSSPLPAPVPALSPRGHGRFGRVLAADDSGGGRARWTSNYIHPVVARPNYMAVVSPTAVCMTCSSVPTTAVCMT